MVTQRGSSPPPWALSSRRSRPRDAGADPLRAARDRRPSHIGFRPLVIRHDLTGDNPKISLTSRRPNAAMKPIRQLPHTEFVRQKSRGATFQPQTYLSQTVLMDFHKRTFSYVFLARSARKEGASLWQLSVGVFLRQRDHGFATCTGTGTYLLSENNGAG